MSTPDTATEEIASNDVGLTPPPQKGHTPREILIRKLADLVVLPAARISSNERSLVADIMLQALDKADEGLRFEVARRVARVAEAPNPLLRTLLLDEPRVAEPIIRRIEPVPEALLIECAKNGTTAHRDLIARRIDLTTSLADVLLEFGEPEVAKLLLRREEFQFSPNAIDLLVSRSPADAEVQALLLRRRELEPAHGFMMFWWVSAENRKRILTRFALDRTIVQDAIQDLYPRVFRGDGADPFVKEILIMLDRRHRPRGVNGDPVSMEVVIKTLGAARKYPAQEIIHAASMIAGVSRELVARILRDPGVEPFAVMCKSLGMPRSEFFAIVNRKDAENPIDPARAEILLGIFDSMARDYARAVMRYWDWDGNPRIAHITRLLGFDDEVA
ncbi:MAG: hypothetical protein A3E78_11075 [Alphaproteobacteria bacterium RIFCSPHIGHO2_12_FULL_63_12]|nr:MAG: hypothetical protein A3E78_11075 [Alphaproteobacteria bacterium RIFCSPHIGHO2_12_FULL_63_12]